MATSVNRVETIVPFGLAIYSKLLSPKKTDDANDNRLFSSPFGFVRVGYEFFYVVL